jgi:MFS family permease
MEIQTIKKDTLIDYLAEFPNYLSMFLVPVFLLFASPILLDISKSINVDVRNLSLIFSFFTIGQLIGQLTSVLYNIRFSKILIVVAAYVLLLPICILLSFASSLYVFYISYFFGGYFLGIIYLQASEFILESKIENKPRLLNILFAFYPLGAFVAPFLSTGIVKSKLSWRFIYYIIIIFVLLITLLYLTITRKRKYRISTEQKRKITFKKIFSDKNKNILFFITFILMLVYTIPETIVFTWSPTFFRVERMFDIATAGIIVSIFWISVGIGRFIIGSIAGKINTNYLMLLLLIIASISITFMVFFDIKYIIFIAIVFFGLSSSGIYPLLISSGSTIYEEGRGVLITFLYVAEAMGLSIAPYLTRFISKYNMTLSISVSIILLGFIIILVLINILYRKKFIDNKTIMDK